MTHEGRGWAWERKALVAAFLAVAVAAPAWAQRANPNRNPPAQREVTAAEVERLFGAYAVMQAQEVLALDDAQFARFLPKMRALQTTRRRLEIERNRVTAELARLTAPGQPDPDEGALRERLRILAELDVRGAAEVRAAYEAVDQTLDLRQQARFRVFELQMERRKFELMMRARTGGAGREF